MQTVDTSFSVLDVYNRPIGLVKSVDKDCATIITQGVYSVENGKGSLVPGRYYYGNSRGDFIQGEWAGQRGVDSYFVYIENNEEKMLTAVHNRIGFAISERKLMVQTRQLLWGVSYYMCVHL